MAKIALVTGAGSGIGRAVSLGFLRAGYAVVLAGRRRAALEETLALAPGAPDALVVPTDIRDEGSVAALFDAATATFGRVDLLFQRGHTFSSWYSMRSRSHSAS